MKAARLAGADALPGGVALPAIERRARARVSLRRLMASAADSARGGAAADVDNTGNVRVWPAEHVMLHTLLRRFGGGGERVGLGGARVLELGDVSEEVSSTTTREMLAARGEWRRRRREGDDGEWDGGEAFDPEVLEESLRPEVLEYVETHGLYGA